MDRKRPTRIRWLLLAWIFVMSGITYLDRVNIAISGGRLAQEYGLSDVELGSIFSAFVIGYALFQIPGGWLADRFGARRVLTGGALWWGVFTALTASVPARLGAALPAFLAVRFSLGAGEAVVYPSSNRFVAHWIPTGERGVANGVIFAGVGAGAGSTPLLITAIMARYGWRASFWFCAGIGCLAGLVWFVLARDQPESHPGVNAAELDLIRAGRTIVTDAAPSPQSRLAWRTVLGSREILASTFSYYCYGYTAYIFFTWFFTYLVKVRG
ncbi:MAG TPA: MFS transporter, partial [Terriglobia bacterium]|nr:MFS transporter [Terriglobia bacterium]